MNKAIWFLPKPMIENYILKNFDKVTEEEYFKIIEKKINIPFLYYTKNEKIKKSKKVLKYAIKNGLPIVEHFDVNLFDEEIFSSLVESNYKLYDDFVSKNKFLFSNSQLKFIFSKPELRNQILSSDISLVSLLDSEYIDQTVINLMEEKKYCLTENDIQKNPIFLTSDKLILNTIKVNPKIILSLPELKSIYIDSALANDYIPSLEDFKKKKELIFYYPALKKGFQYNHNIIKYFPKEFLNYTVCKEAIDRGYVVSEEDLIMNPNLANQSLLMTQAIINNPKLILFLGKDTYIEDTVIIQALKNYTITEEDLIKHPDICQNNLIMSKLPHFELYNNNLSEERRKEEIIKCLKQHDYNGLIKLPFLQEGFGYKINSQDLQKLISLLIFEYNENDMNVQENYYQFLNQIIESIVNMRYHVNKESFLFKNVVDLDNEMLNAFFEVKETKNEILLEEFIQKIYSFVNYDGQKNYIGYEFLKEKIMGFYIDYLKSNSLSKEKTINFYNEILNQHYNCFFVNQKKQLVKEIFLQFSLTKKKEETILTSRKIQKISDYIKFNRYDILEIRKEELLNILMSVRASLINNKELRKKGIVLTEEHLSYFEEFFMVKGIIPEKNIMILLDTNDESIAKFIINKYEQIKRRFLDKVTLDEQEKLLLYKEIKMKLGFNYNNFIIANHDLYYENIAALILKLDKDITQDILENSEYLSEIASIIPLFNLTEEINLDILIMILRNYKKIREKLLNHNTDINSNEVVNLIVKNFQELVRLAKAYTNSDDLNLIILGDKVTKKIGDTNNDGYFQYYQKMFNRFESNIPVVAGEFEDKKYESGIFSDPERLLIGKYVKNSCVDLGGAGNLTYIESLTEKTGDVIIIRNKKTNDFVARILIFRRGNVVQLGCANGLFGVIDYPEEFYKEIAKQIIDTSNITGDNIEYVFMADTTKTPKNFQKIKCRELTTLFPHADFTNEAYLIGCRNPEELEKINLENLDFQCTPNKVYLKKRKGIITNADSEELTRIKALRIKLESDSLLQEQLRKSFQPVSVGEFKKIVSGEDWYIGIKFDGTLEKVIVPTSDFRKYEEIEKILNTLEIDFLESEKRIK